MALYKLTALLSAVFIFVTAQPAYSKTTGNILVYSDADRPVSLEMPMPSLDKATFSTELISFTALPEGMVPDERGCYCFEQDDHRYAYVQALFYTSRQLQEINETLVDLGMPALNGFTITLTPEEGLTTGQVPTGTKHINLGYPSPTYDLTTLAHEFAHAVHYGLIGVPNKGRPADIQKNNYRRGIIEGVANILAALHTGTERISYKGTYDVSAPNVNVFIRIPDVTVTKRDSYTSIVESVLFAKHYPDIVREVRTGLRQLESTPEGRAYLDLWDEYHTSAAFTQPLWQAQQRFGRKQILRIVIAAIADLPNFDTYNELTAKILEVTADVELRELLQHEFALRGLFLDTDSE